MNKQEAVAKPRVGMTAGVTGGGLKNESAVASAVGIDTARESHRIVQGSKANGMKCCKTCISPDYGLQTRRLL